MTDKPQTTTEQLIAHREKLIAMRARMYRYTYAPGLLFDKEIEETTRLIESSIKPNFTMEDMYAYLGI